MKNHGKKVKSAAIFCNLKKEGILDFVRGLSWLLNREGVDCHVELEAAQLMGLSGFARESVPQVDLVFSLGGDGTMLATTDAVAEREIPILGINLGHLGFLTELDAGEIGAAIPRIIAGEFTIDNRMMLLVKFPGETREQCALNELVVDRGQSPRSLSFEVFVSEQLVAKVPADGMIVSTPTGSTAYNMSAGGSIMSPGMSAFQIIALNPHTLSLRPVVVGADETIRIAYVGEAKGSPRASLDGRLGLDIPCEGDIIVRKAPFSAHFVHYHEQSFYSVLRKKLGWALSPGVVPKDAI